MIKTPEKIYVRVKHDKVLNEWNNTLSGVHDIEYIRTDVFIEKVTKYLSRALTDTEVIDDYRGILVRGIVSSYTSVEEFINNFKNYIKED